MRLALAVLLFIFSFWVNPIYADSIQEQVEHRSFEQGSYEKAIEGLDYTESYRPKVKPEKRRDSRKNNGIDLPSFDGLGEIFKVVAITFIVLVLGFLLFRLIDENYFGIGQKNKANPNITFENLEEHIHEVDLDALLQQALANNDYRQAIRIYYLIIIKQLSNSDAITWKKEKTNGEYVSEMYGKKNFEDFRQVTTLFERVWYGDMILDESKYQMVAPKFSALNNKVKPLMTNETK